MYKSGMQGNGSLASFGSLTMASIQETPYDSVQQGRGEMITLLLRMDLLMFPHCTGGPPPQSSGRHESSRRHVPRMSH